MKEASIRGPSLALSLAALLSLVGCVSQHVAGDGASNRAPATRNAITESGSNTSTTPHALASPTGNKATSALLLERLSPAKILVDNEFHYEIRVTNLSAFELTDVIVTDRIPESLTINGSEPALLNRTAGEARWGLGSIAPNGQTTIRVTATSSQTGSLKANSTGSYSFLVASMTNVIRPELSLSMAIPGKVLVGDTFPLTLSVANNGIGAAQNIQVTYVPPEGFSIVKGKSTWELATLEPGKSQKLPGLTLRAERPGRHAHQASAAAEMTNGTISADSPPVSLHVLQANLTVVRSGPKTTAVVGHPFRYEIKITNTGNALARNLVYKHPVPEGLKILVVSKSGVLGDRSVTWNIGDLNPKASKTLYLSIVSDEIRDVVFPAGTFEGIGESPVTHSGTERVRMLSERIARAE